MSKIKIVPRSSYNFGRLKRGGMKSVKITKADPTAGLRALTAAYAYARRHNAAAKKKSDHVRFVGRLSKDGKTRYICRVQ